MPRIIAVPADEPTLLALEAELITELAARYGDDGDIAATSPHASWVLLLDDADTAIGCGAVQPLAKTVPGAAEHVGEIKRVYVVPEARGRGLSRAVMAALVDLAGSEGYRRLHLETGTAQPEAIALYRSSGWQVIENYGQYADDERSVCFALDLDD
jgi:GNAT superfamily N-acetyltransferase